jgi:hypothetical protein
MIAKPESIKGEMTSKIKPPKKSQRRKTDEMTRPLTRWLKPDNVERKNKN